MLRIDLVDWIAPDVVAGVASTSTFRDASTVLPWLEYSHVRLPPWDGQQIEVSLVFPKILTSLASFPGVVLRRHSACFGNPTHVDFHAIGATAGPPIPLRSFDCLVERLQHLRLFGDLLRGTLHLWSLGIGAILVVPHLRCPAITALSSLALFSRSLKVGQLSFELGSSLSLFTPLITANRMPAASDSD